MARITAYEKYTDKIIIRTYFGKSTNNAVTKYIANNSITQMLVIKKVFFFIIYHSSLKMSIANAAP